MMFCVVCPLPEWTNNDSFHAIINRDYAYTHPMVLNRKEQYCKSTAFEQNVMHCMNNPLEAVLNHVMFRRDIYVYIYVCVCVYW